MEIKKGLAPLERFLPMEKLLSKVETPAAMSPEPVTEFLPSITLAADGPVLVGLLMVTENFLCDIRIAGTEPRLDFDFTAKRSVVDYRFVLWTQELKLGEEVRGFYELAQVTLRHTAENMYTQLVYAGDARSAWLERMLRALPISILEPGRR